MKNENMDSSLKTFFKLCVFTQQIGTQLIAMLQKPSLKKETFSF